MTQKAIEGNEIALTTLNFESRCKGQQLIDKQKKKKLASLLLEEFFLVEKTYTKCSSHNCSSISSPSSQPLYKMIMFCLHAGL